MAFGRHDAIRFTRFSALLVKKTAHLGRKRAKQLSFPPLKKKSVGILRDVISGCLLFRKIAMIAKRKERVSRPFGSTTAPLNTGTVHVNKEVQSFLVYISHLHNSFKRCRTFSSARDLSRIMFSVRSC
jgi:hypothetical protein